MAEFALIERIRRRAAARADVILGIGDDAALLQPTTGQLLAVSTDVLNEGVHFRADDPPEDIGWKALAVNLSDLAAMGSEPAWAMLTLSLPRPDGGWLDRFLDGFGALAAQHRVALVGGDTTRGPRAIGVTVHGFVPATAALRRSGAHPGDEIWVTGTLGDAAAALADPQFADLLPRLRRPTPRVTAGHALRELASACIDVSDGLFADLGHVLEASGVGADLQLAQLPCSLPLARLRDDAARWRLQCSGGEDYELCFTAAAGNADALRAALAACATPVSCIGRIGREPGLRAFDRAGRRWHPSSFGYQHFAGEQR